MKKRNVIMSTAVAGVLTLAMAPTAAIAEASTTSTKPASAMGSGDTAAVAEAGHEAEVKEALLPDLSIGQYTLLAELSTGALIGRRVDELVIDKGFHLEAIRRDGRVLRADDDLVLQADDQITLIGPLGGLPEFDNLAAILGD